MIDRTTKALLLAIALGLWANALSTKTDANEPLMLGIGSRVSGIEAAANSMEEKVANIEAALENISNGLCLNNKIC